MRRGGSSTLSQREHRKQRRRPKMEDMSVLREQYRQSRDSQRSHTHVLLFGTESEQLSDAVSIVPVTQGFTSSPPPEREPCSLGPYTFDPWHIHLDLHRRFSCSHMVAPSRVHSPKLNSSRWSSSSSSSSPKSPVKTHQVNSTPGSQRFTLTSTCNRTNGDPSTGSDDPAQNPGEGTSSPSPSSEVQPVGSHCSIRCSTNDRGSGSACLHHNQDLNQNLNHFPFPSRKKLRISEAARRLGLYSF